MKPLLILLAGALTVAGSSLLHPPAADSRGLQPDATLAECLDYAVQNNRAINAASEHWRAAKARVPQARGWPDPRLSYGYFAESVETRVGPQEHRIGITQPLPWFGKLKAAGNVASAEAAEALADLSATQLQVVQQVKDAWFELAWLEQAVQIAEDNVELLSQLEGVAQTRFRSGGSLVPVTQAQVEIGKLQDRLASLEDMRTPLLAGLNALLNRPPDAPLQPPTSISTNSVSLPEMTQLHAMQQEANPMIEQLASRILRETHAIRLARKQGRPEFGVGVDYIVTGEARMAGVPDSGKDPVIAMFSVSIPLWRGKYKAMVNEAEARRSAAEASLEDKANQLRSMLEMAHYEFRDAARKINLYGATLLPQARSSLNVAQQNYEAGNSDFLNLIDAQRVLLNFEIEYQRALANRQQSLAQIEMLVGGSLPSTLGENLQVQESQP